MRQIILTVSVVLIFVSCGQSDKKQLKLKEEALTLQEKDSVKVTVSTDTLKAKHDQATALQPLVLTPLNIDGDIGYITFSQKGKTIFYYDAKTKRGKIILNGIEYILNKRDGSYKLSGNNISISTTKGNWEEMVSDCAYGKSLVVTIKMGVQVLKLNDVEVQDCSGMVE